MGWNPLQPPRHLCRPPDMNPLDAATDWTCPECGADWQWNPVPAQSRSAAEPEETPVNGQIVHIADDGTQTDVTAGVQALYDLVIHSMDFRSGFWSYEDAVPVAAIAHLCGFEQAEEVERYVRQALHEKESSEWQCRQRSMAQAYVEGRNVPHDHVYSSVGKCMWSYCSTQQPAPSETGKHPDGC